MTLSPSIYRTRFRPAFTIIELLIAISITAAITAMMLTIVTNVLKNWSRSTATLSTGNEARLILDQVASDLQGAVLKSSTDVMLAATIAKDQSGTGDAGASSASWAGSYIKPGDSAAPNGSLQLNPADRDLEGYRFGQAGVWLRLLATPPDNSQTSGSVQLSDVSAPRAVAYQIMRRRVGSSAAAPYTYQLFRSEVRPYGTSAATISHSTFTTGYDFFANNGYNDTSTGGTGVADAGCIRQPRAEYVIGDGVIDFGVRIFIRNSSGTLQEAFPIDRRSGGATVRRVFAATTDTTKTMAVSTPSGNFSAADTSYGYPNVIEVMIRILTPEGVEIMQAYEADPNRFGGASAGKWWELAEANSKIYVRRIEVRSTAL